VNAILSSPAATAAARAVLEGLFSEAFVDKIDNGTYSFANTGTYSFVSDDGLYSATVTGDGKTTVKSITDAASMLYNLYVVAPAMTNEVNVDFNQYIPSDQARELAYLQDAQDFYQMGPGIQEANPVTYKMAQALEEDFFNEVDAIEHGDARLRLPAIDVRPGDVPAASDHARKKRSKIGCRTHGAAHKQRNILDDLRINTAAKFRVFVVQRGNIGRDVWAVAWSLSCTSWRMG